MKINESDGRYMNKTSPGRRAAIAAAAALISFSLVFSCYEKAGAGRPKGEDENPYAFTVLYYMVGSDLESFCSAASTDIEEMVAARKNDSVKILLETGGASKWQNELIDPNSCQRFEVTEDGLSLIEDLGGAKQMSSDRTLSEFIAFAKDKYPSDRYALILWNHGGGTIMGFGLDENYPDKMLKIDQIRTALADGGVHFDFIGFDACLMCTLETALAVSPYADYMIASEETEPSGGWHHTSWLNVLSKDPKASVERIGSAVIDGFFNAPDYNRYDYHTLSLLDLAKVGEVYSALREYFSDKTEAVRADYPGVARARSFTKSFGNGHYEQVDLFNLIEKMEEAGFKDTKKVRAALSSLVVSQRSSIDGANGLAVYYPLDLPEKYNDTLRTLGNIDYDSDYFSFYSLFLNTLVAGQKTVGNKPESEEELKNQEWFDSEAADGEALPTIGENELGLYEKHYISGVPYYALSLEDKTWDLVSDAFIRYELQYEGTRIVLGSEYALSYDTDMDLEFGSFANQWHTMNGMIVPYYCEGFTWGKRKYDPYIDRYYNDEYIEHGYTPAIVNGWYVNIETVIDTEHPDGYILGYRIAGDDFIDWKETRDLRVPEKGYRRFKEGDRIQLYYNIYDIDPDGAGPMRRMNIGEEFTYDGAIETGFGRIVLEGQEPRDLSILRTFCIRDIYRNTYYSDSLMEYPNL